MNRPETDDQRLAALLRDAVADIEPADRLPEVRAGIPQRRSNRRWAAVGGGSVLAVAATVTAIALATSPGPTATDPDVADAPEPNPVTTAVPAYFVGETPRGDRLYREFQPVADAVTGLAGLGALESGPGGPRLLDALAGRVVRGPDLRPGGRGRARLPHRRRPR